MFGQCESKEGAERIGSPLRGERPKGGDRDVQFGQAQRPFLGKAGDPSPGEGVKPFGLLLGHETQDDPEYSYLSEIADPRFAGLQLTAFRIEREGAERPIAHLYLGGLPLEIPHVLLATLAPGSLLGRLAIALEHLVVMREVARTWPTVARQVTEHLLPGYEGVIALLDRHGVGQDISAEMLREVRTALEHARELERLAQEAWAEEDAAGDP